MIYWTAIFTAFLTAFYTGRAFFMTFFGPEKFPSPDDPEADPHAEPADAHGHEPHGEVVTGLPHAHHGEIGHESPPLMTYPLMALAGCTVLIGLICFVIGPFFGGATEWFAGHLQKTLGFESLGHAEHAFSWLTAIIGTLVGVGGIGLSYFVYGHGKATISLGARIKPLYEASLNKFYIDEIYQRVVVGPIRGLAIVCEFVDMYLVDGLVIGVAHSPTDRPAGVVRLPERLDSVLRGRLGGKRGGPSVDSLAAGLVTLAEFSVFSTVLREHPGF